MLNNVSLRQLRTFLAVAQTRSFRRASELVHLSQPTVTSHVQQIEEGLGVQLFDRTTRRVLLTPAGERFQTRAEQVLGNLDAVTQELRSEALLERGLLAVACVPTLASHLLPKTVAGFTARHPGITLRVADVVAPEMYELLSRAQADIGFGPRPRGNPQLDFQLLTGDPYVAIVPRHHPWARRKSVTLKEFASGPVLTMPVGSNVRDTLDESLAAEGLSLNPIHEVRHYYTLGGMVEAGLGITALPSMAVSVMSQPLLKTIPIRRPEVIRQIGVIHLRGHSLSAAAKAFVGIFAQVVEEELE